MCCHLAIVAGAKMIPIQSCAHVYGYGYCAITIVTIAYIAGTFAFVRTW